MPEEPPKPVLALLMIGALYVTQGLPMGLAFMALPAILRKLGYSTEAIGMVGLVILPWALKFLWAPFVDRSGNGWLGRRRSWIIPAQIIIVLLYGFIALTAASHVTVTAIIVLLVFANTVSATQDIAADGWTVELLRGPRLAWANGLQIGGFASGMLIGGAVTVAVFEHGGWIYAFGLLAALTALSIVPVLLVPDGRRDGNDRRGAPAPSLREMIRRPGALVIISVAALFHFASSMVGAMLGPFLVDSGLSLVDVGVITGTGIACIAIVGAATGGMLARTFGARPTAIAAGFVSALSLSLWTAGTAFFGVSVSTAVAIMCVTGVAGGIAYVAFYTIFMQWASLDQAGTDFTVLQCTESCTNIVAAIVAGFLASRLGFGGLFLFATAIGLLAMGWISLALARLSNATLRQQAIPDPAR
jgi:RhtX/FptX family siderophore transporter